MRLGDGRTPEGRFRVVTRNVNSPYHRFLGISYPDLGAIDRGLKEGLITPGEADSLRRAHDLGICPDWNTSLGGGIGIHGGRRGNFAEDNFAQGNFVEGNFVEGNFAEDNFAQGNFVEGNFVEGNFVKGNFAQGNFVEGEDWTGGCIALGDEDVEELFNVLRLGDTVEILP